MRVRGDHGKAEVSPPPASSPPGPLCLPLPVTLPLHIPSVFEVAEASPLSLPVPEGLLSLFRDLPIPTSVTPLSIFNMRASGTLTVFRPSQCLRSAERAVRVSPGPAGSAAAPYDFGACSSFRASLDRSGRGLLPLAPWLSSHLRQHSG